jgi:hypothetical protein
MEGTASGNTARSRPSSGDLPGFSSIFPKSICEQNDPAGHFERMYVNADRVENGADGFSDIEGKATRVGASECGQRMSFN